MKKFILKSTLTKEMILESVSPEIIINEIFKREEDGDLEHYLLFYDEDKRMYKILLDKEKLDLKLIVKMYRYAKGYSLKDMDKKLGLSRNAYSKYFTREMKFNTILKICIVLDIKLKVLEPLKKYIINDLNIDL